MNAISDFIEKNDINASRGIKLLSPQNAILLIEMLIEKNIPIYGFDAIFVTDEGMQPSLADSMDLSNLIGQGMTVPQAHMHMIQMIKDRSDVKDIFFEIVYKKK